MIMSVMTQLVQLIWLYMEFLLLIVFKYMWTGLLLTRRLTNRLWVPMWVEVKVVPDYA